jgi:hypothetical protein
MGKVKKWNVNYTTAHSQFQKKKTGEKDDMAYLCSIFPILIVIAIVLDSCLYFNITDFPDGLQIFHTNRVVFGMTFGYQTNDR